ncbi:MAG: hypothetical protein ABH864_04150 [archaeon]
MVISVLTSNCSALEINLDSPSEVEIDEEFTVGISVDSETPLDIKIFVHKSNSENIKSSDYISEIYDEESESWKNSWYYLKEYFPDHEKYEIRVTGSPGEREICARLREPDTKKFYTECNSIKVTGEEKEDEEDSEEESDDDEDMDEKDEEDTKEINEPIPNVANENVKEISCPKTKLTLNGAKEKPLNPPNNVKTKEGTKTTVILYSFAGFCVLAIVLLALRKL